MSKCKWAQDKKPCEHEAMRDDPFRSVRNAKGYCLIHFAEDIADFADPPMPRHPGYDGCRCHVGQGEGFTRYSCAHCVNQGVDVYRSDYTNEGGDYAPHA